MKSVPNWKPVKDQGLTTDKTHPGRKREDHIGSEPISKKH